MLTFDSAYGEVVEGISYSWIGLERHTLPDTVNVQASDGTFLIYLIGLFINDRADSHYFSRGKAKSRGFLSAFLIPNTIIVLSDFLNKFIGGR